MNWQSFFDGVIATLTLSGVAGLAFGLLLGDRVTDNTANPDTRAAENPSHNGDL